MDADGQSGKLPCSHLRFEILFLRIMNVLQAKEGAKASIAGGVVSNLPSCEGTSVLTDVYKFWSSTSILFRGDLA